MNRRRDLIATTTGLATAEFDGEGCEQAYVRETGDEKRPILVEFWEGYAVPNKAVLTKNQAVQLAYIILRWASPSASGGLTRMLREGMMAEPMCDADAQTIEDGLNDTKSVFKKWLSEVGLPDYFSLNRIGEGFNSTKSIRQLLVTLVDEP